LLPSRSLGKNKDGVAARAPAGQLTKGGVMANWPRHVLAFCSSSALRACALAAALVVPAGDGALAQQVVGPVTGLPVPRYVSLKSDHVNLREGPSKDHATKWIYQRAGLPVEITAEYETWRRIRDSEGAEGWVLHSLLSGRRTALVAPWKKDAPAFPLRAEIGDDSRIVVKLAPGVVAHVKKCDGAWCRLKVDGYDGYLAQTNLWGVYPGEKVE
jgi:SH3-like domain-containing protein